MFRKSYQKSRPISTVCYFCQQGIKEIDYQEAHKQCTALISFCEIVMKPFPKEGIE